MYLTVFARPQCPLLFLIVPYYSSNNHVTASERYLHAIPTPPSTLPYPQPTLTYLHLTLYPIIPQPTLTYLHLTLYPIIPQPTLTYLHLTLYPIIPTTYPTIPPTYPNIPQPYHLPYPSDLFSKFFWLLIYYFNVLISPQTLKHSK